MLGKQNLQLKPLAASPLYQRRKLSGTIDKEPDSSDVDPDYTELGAPSGASGATMSLGTMFCCKCGEGFEPHEKIVNSHGEVWHQQCFVCCQCFRPFPEGTFYEFEGRKYCKHDFHVLFAPCCGKCKNFVFGRVIKAMNNNWHPECFTCELCNTMLADQGFIKNAGRIELNADAREVKGDLYCLRCHDKMGIPICGACRRPIEERVVTALGKNWHVEHFVCAKCEKPFLGHRHYEKKGLAYCEIHYHQLFGNLCFVCNNVIGGDVFTALNKAWCVNHFACYVCDQKMSQKTKFFEVDLKPVCKKCYDKFPAEFRKRLKKAYEASPKKIMT
ncbi:UNVERIFIED_CONTAM: LIM and senescent cell antigen-like-containing domain protein 2 [Trichonephila clavipes]